MADQNEHSKIWRVVYLLECIMSDVEAPSSSRVPECIPESSSERSASWLRKSSKQAAVEILQHTIEHHAQNEQHPGVRVLN